MDLPPIRDPEACDTSFVSSIFGYLIRRTQERTSRQFHERFSDVGLSPVAYATLATIDRNPGVRQGRAAMELGLQESNMASLIKDLVARKLVRRVRSSNDGRVYGLILTKGGKEFIRRMNIRALELDRDYTAMLTKEERDTLLRLLRKILSEKK